MRTPPPRALSHRARRAWPRLRTRWRGVVPPFGNHQQGAFPPGEEVEGRRLKAREHLRKESPESRARRRRRTCCSWTRSRRCPTSTRSSCAAASRRRTSGSDLQQSRSCSAMMTRASLGSALGLAPVSVVAGSIDGHAWDVENTFAPSEQDRFQKRGRTAATAAAEEIYPHRALGAEAGDLRAKGLQLLFRGLDPSGEDPSLPSSSKTSPSSGGTPWPRRRSPPNTSSPLPPPAPPPPASSDPHGLPSGRLLRPLQSDCDSQILISGLGDSLGRTRGPCNTRHLVGSVVVGAIPGPPGHYGL